MDLLIFDMDGVLIDVSGSYRKTVAQSIHIYFKECLGIKLKTISNEDISLFKAAGGFNNDWDLTSGFLLYLLSLSGLPPCPKRAKFADVKEAISFLKIKSSEFSPPATKPPQKNHLPDFLKKVKDLGGGLKGVRLTLKNLWDGWVYGSGDLERENLVKRIFQEVYLGEKFTSHYHLQPLFYRGNGLYLREKLLIGRDVLSSLRKKMKLGIASGRPRFEAELALKRFRIFDYFNSLVTLDECEQEEARISRSTGKRIKLSKPHPYSILRAVEEVGLSDPKCAYIGDTVDDMRAAKAARKKLDILAVGFVGFVSSHAKRKEAKESLLHAGADLLVENPKDLLRVIN